MFAWHEVPVEAFFIDQEQTMPFTGWIDTEAGVAIAEGDGTEYTTLYGPAVENGAPMTALAFQAGLGDVGKYLVILCVFLIRDINGHLVELLW